MGGGMTAHRRAQTAPIRVTAWHRLPGRGAMAWIFGIAGLLAYNWWVLVPFRPGLMRSPSELFSNLEVTGQPFATAMQHADLLSGLFLLGSFLAAGSRSIPGGRRDWLAMMVFAAAGALGGLFPEVCADEISARCRTMEWDFQLPLHQHLHIATGIFEFGGITVALLLACQRTRNERARTARVYRNLARAAAAAYLLNRLGGVVEAVFFTGFTVMAATRVGRKRTFLAGLAAFAAGSAWAAFSGSVGVLIAARRRLSSCAGSTSGPTTRR